MARYVNAAAGESIWIEASPTSPCLRCGAMSGCTSLADGEFLVCLTEVSERPLASGGWLHRKRDLRRVETPLAAARS